MIYIILSILILQFDDCQKTARTSFQSSLPASKVMGARETNVPGFLRHKRLSVAFIELKGKDKRRQTLVKFSAKSSSCGHKKDIQSQRYLTKHRW